MDPDDWKSMVQEVRYVEAMLGGTEKKVEDNEKATVVVQQRSLRATKYLSRGTLITEELIDVLPCPLGSMKPYQINEIIGKRLISNIASGDFFSHEHFEKEN